MQGSKWTYTHQLWHVGSLANWLTFASVSLMGLVIFLKLHFGKSTGLIINAHSELQKTWLQYSLRLKREYWMSFYKLAGILDGPWILTAVDLDGSVDKASIFWCRGLRCDFQSSHIFYYHCFLTLMPYKILIWCEEEFCVRDFIGGRNLKSHRGRTWYQWSAGYRQG